MIHWVIKLLEGTEGGDVGRVLLQLLLTLVNSLFIKERYGMNKRFSYYRRGFPGHCSKEVVSVKLFYITNNNATIGVQVKV